MWLSLIYQEQSSSWGHYHKCSYYINYNKQDCSGTLFCVGTTKYDKTLEVWKSPSPPYYKINYDTVIRATFFAPAAVCRDSTDSIIKCIYLISSPYSALYGEATAALLATRLARSLGLSSFILEGDSLNVTLAIQHPAITTDSETVEKGGGHGPSFW
jgi:hypothetical protein